MKKLLLVFLVLGSLSAFAEGTKSNAENMDETVNPELQETQMQEETIGTDSGGLEESKQHQDEPVIDDSRIDDSTLDSAETNESI